jgi:hypothetical protein
MNLEPHEPAEPEPAELEPESMTPFDAPEMQVMIESSGEEPGPE